ncbi:MAG: SDR family NAD(P)-dependent oxidoreductase [Mycobacteriales bacterium]
MSPGSRTVVVTGAGGLLGRAFVAAFRDAGERVVAVGRTWTSLVEAYGADPDVTVVAADLADPAAVLRLAAEHAADAGVLVNNAGMTSVRTPLLDIEPDVFDQMVAVNLRATYLLTREFGRAWRDRGEGGAIVNLSSPGAVQAHFTQSVYDATKAGVAAFTRASAVELGQHGIRVNCLQPGSVNCDDTEAAGMPLRRAVRPEEVAAAAVFLASPAASAITGVSLPVDGGVLAQLRVRL